MIPALVFIASSLRRTFERLVINCATSVQFNPELASGHLNCRLDSIHFPSPLEKVPKADEA